MPGAELLALKLMNLPEAPGLIAALQNVIAGLLHPLQSTALKATISRRAGRKSSGGLQLVSVVQVSANARHDVRSHHNLELTDCCVITDWGIVLVLAMCASCSDSGCTPADRVCSARCAAGWAAVVNSSHILYLTR